MPLQQSVLISLMIASIALPSNVQGSNSNSNNNSYQVISSSTSTLPKTQEAEYTCSFTNQWTAYRHPQSYPRFDAHWTHPILFSHDSSYNLWEDGKLASQAVQDIAEAGDTTALLDELYLAGSAAGDLKSGHVHYNDGQNSQTLPDILIDPDHPLLSSITMIAPSPDWFSGFHDLSLVDGQYWLESVTVETWAWDSGTKDGDAYDYFFPATDPPQPVNRFTKDNLPATEVFASPYGSTVLPVARWECMLKPMVKSMPEVCLPTHAACGKPSDCCSGICGGFSKKFCFAAIPGSGNSRV